MGVKGLPGEATRRATTSKTTVRNGNDRPYVGVAVVPSKLHVLHVFGKGGGNVDGGVVVHPGCGMSRSCSFFTVDYFCARNRTTERCIFEQFCVLKHYHLRPKPLAKTTGRILPQFCRWACSFSATPTASQALTRASSL